MDKILVIQIAALGYKFLKDRVEDCRLGGMEFRPLKSVFPAVTCTAQATMRTGLDASGHGMVGNGFFFRELAKPLFWEQSSNLVSGGRIWESLRKRGGRVGQLFIQQSLGTDSDLVVSPAPIHKHHGGMIQDCYSRPGYLYRDLVKSVGRSFKLGWYWGPLASVKSSRWITRATMDVMRTEKPDLLFTYLPHLDYELQRTGPSSDKSGRALDELGEFYAALVNAASDNGYKIVAWGDYAITDADTPVFPNRVLRSSGLFNVRRIKKMAYPDFHSSRAFAVVDHQVAHVFIRDESDKAAVKTAFKGLRGVARVLDEEEKKAAGIDHPRAGRLILEAEKHAWFAYPWWEDKREAPDYATHIDIHNKPGYDPCELFFGKLPIAVSTAADRIRGSGRLGEGMEAAWATNVEFENAPESILELSKELKHYLERETS